MDFYQYKPKQPKFDQTKAKEIRQGHQNGVSYRELAALYKADKNTIWHICREKGAYSRKKWM